MKCWVQGTGYKVLSTKCWIQGATYGVLNMKCWIQGAGCEVALSKTPSLPHLVLTLCLCTLPYLKSLQPPSSLALLASPVLAGGRLGQGWWPELLLLAGGRDLQHLITRQNVMQFHPWTALKAGLCWPKDGPEAVLGGLLVLSWAGKSLKHPIAGSQ